MYYLKTEADNVNYSASLMFLERANTIFYIMKTPGHVF